VDALKNENELSEQIKKLAEHLTFIERKLDQLLEKSDRQPSHNENPRREFPRPGGFRPNNSGYRPNGGPGGPGGFRPARPSYGQGGAPRPYDKNRGENRPSSSQGRPSSGPGPGQGGQRSSGGPGGHTPFHSKFSSKNNNRSR
jgi:hypothetical protein